MVDKSKQVVETLWGSFRMNEDGGMVGGGTLPSAHGTDVPRAEDEFYWTRFLTRDELALHLDVRGLHLGLERAGDDSMRLVVSKARLNSRMDTLATFTVRSTLAEVFAVV